MVSTPGPPTIQWDPPPPRSGPGGWLDRFIGPEASAAELWLQFGGALIAAVAIPLFAVATHAGWSTLQIVFAVVLTFDLVGGVITNATATAQRWYHRRGQGSWQHLGFIAIHIAQLALVAWLFRDGDWLYLAVFYLYLLVAACCVTFAPLYLQRPVAMAVFVGAVLMDHTVFSPTPAMGWFVPVFFAKLLLSHLPRHAPYAREQQILNESEDV